MTPLGDTSVRTTSLHSHDDRLLRRSEVLAMTGMSKSMLYLLMSKNDFPRPVRIGVRAVAWRRRGWNLGSARGLVAGGRPLVVGAL